MMDDAMAAHQWRLAQANRLLRHYEQQGIDINGELPDRLNDLDLSPICGSHGTIQPEAVDLAAVKALE